MFCRKVLQKKILAFFLVLCALFLLIPSASHARNILVSDAQDSVKYKIPGVDDSRLMAVKTLQELFANVVKAGDVVYFVENWDSGGSGGNDEVDETWDTRDWDARFIVTELIEISREVEI